MTSYVLITGHTTIVITSK